MYELDSLKTTLQRIANSRSRIVEINSDTNKAELERMFGIGHVYPGISGQLSAVAESSAQDAAFAIATIDRAIKAVALLDRLAAVMHNEFDVSAYEPMLGESRGDWERELRLLELLAEPRYEYERDHLRRAISGTLGDVEQQERENEFEGALDALRGAGFLEVERDDFEGLERGNERVSTAICKPGGSFGYSFCYEVDGRTVAEGESGEFNKLLDAVGIKQEVKA